MTNLNKGRFKCADEAQSVWNLFYRICSSWSISGFKTNDLTSQNEFDSLADSLHKARLIHGSIDDGHGRIEDKNVAQAVCLKVLNLPSYFVTLELDYLQMVEYGLIESGEIRGTIFY